ncbi:hypothetical protein HPB47_012702, partial [Ixodes persulcatus]
DPAYAAVDPSHRDILDLPPPIHAPRLAITAPQSRSFDEEDNITEDIADLIP